MSWDVILFSARGIPSGSVEAWPKGFQPKTLGTASTVRSLVTSAWPGVDWSDPAWGWYESNDLAAEINLQQDGEVSGLMLHVRGGDDPVPPIRHLCATLDAVAIDTSTGDLLARDSRASGYFGWVEFRNQVIEPPPERP